MGLLASSGPWLLLRPVRLLTALADEAAAPNTAREPKHAPVPGLSVRRPLATTPLLAAFDSQIVLHPAVVLLEDGILLAQRESFPLFGQKDAPHIGMAGELDAEHVEHLALEPVGPGVDGHRGLRLRAVGDHGLHAQAFIAGEAV